MATAAVALACLIAPAIAQKNGSAATAEAGSQRDPSSASIRITSPLGRTCVVTRVRIVAQIHIPPGHTLSPVSFFVDGTLVGTTDAAPYSAVDWIDENPFERREI